MATKAQTPAQPSGTLVEVLKRLAEQSKGGNYGHLASADVLLLGAYGTYAPHLRDSEGRAAAKISEAGLAFLKTLEDQPPVPNPFQHTETTMTTPAPVQTPLPFPAPNVPQPAPTHPVDTKPGAGTYTPPGGFSVDYTVDMPAPHIRAGGGKYPFNQMQAPHAGADGKMLYASFFIPATQDHPKPWKAIIGSIAAANKKDSTRKFVSRKVDGGARVWRVK